MIDRNGNKLIFLLCVPRSGSSLATVMLQNHTRIYAAQEMWFLMSLYDLKKPEKRAYGGTAILNQFFDGVLPESVYDEACRNFGVNVYNGLLSTSEADMVVDKSPRYYYILEFIDRLFPQSKRIGLFRNPLDVAASYKKVNQRSAPNFNLVDQLNDPSLNMKMVDITVGLFRYQQYFSQKNENAFRLQYEQMAAHPEEQMQNICQFLDISYEEGIEKYGDYMDSAKSELFYSMGVGDPYLSQHRTPHMKSIGSWRTMLDPKEVEAYCRILGAKLFRDLGYEAELEEAQRLTGVMFEEEPDMKWIEAKTKQFTEATRCDWEPEYKMQSAVLPATSPEVANALSQESKEKAEADELLRMRMTLRSLEKRMEQHYVERDRLQQESERLRKEVRDMKQKMHKIKSLIPFNRSLGRVYNAYLVRKGVEK